ncbi:MAG: hypothetical protein AAB364_00020 [Patescibacteria group bacterium]
MLKKLLQISLLILATFSFALTTQAADLTGYAWSSNIGWISMGNNGQNYGVELNGNNLSGYAWSSNIGWVNFNNINFTGFARAISPNANGSSGWDGQIKLGNGTSYGVTKSGNNLTGFAWGDEVVGWVDFKRVRVDNGLSVTACNAIAVGPDLDFSASVSGGTPGYTYHWTINGTPIAPTANNPYQFANYDEGISYVASVYVEDSAGLQSNVCNTGYGNPPDDSEPTIEKVIGKDRMEINSQPLSSPAVSSSAQFRLSVPLSVGSATLRINHPAAGLSGADVTCRLARTPYAGSTSQFSSCADPITINEGGSNLTLYLTTRVARPVQVLNDNNPYAVTISVDDCSAPNSCSDTATFDYRVGTVNPI